MSELDKCILEIRTVLYGSDGAEPVSEACAQLTLEFLKEDTIRLLIVCLPKLSLGVRIILLFGQAVLFSTLTYSTF